MAHWSSKFQSDSSKNTLAFWRLFLPVLLITLMTVSSLIGAWYFIKSEHEYSSQVSREQAYLQVHAQQFHKELASVIGDLKILASLPALSQSAHLANGARLEELAKVCKSFVQARHVYDQIRYLDIDGNEKVRVNYKDNEAIVVAKPFLQNKKSRYYFQEILQLKPGEVYLSRLDLSIENGFVEVPFKPMLRLGVMLFTQDSAGQRVPQGVLVINYLADNLIQLIQPINLHADILHTDSPRLQMLDTEGYWLRSSRPEEEWGFMFPGSERFNLAEQKPALWNSMQHSRSGVWRDDTGSYQFQFIQAKNLKLQVSEKVIDVVSLVPSKQVGQDYGWYLLSFIPESEYSTQAKQKLRDSLWLIYLSFLIALLLAYFVTKYRLMLQQEAAQTEYIAFHDALTGAYNRRAWEDYISVELRDGMNSGDSNVAFALAYVDLNDFKPINDSEGHDFGDEVLKVTVSRLKGAVREGDYVVRLGGDEFLVVFNSIQRGLRQSDLRGKLSAAFEKPFHVCGKEVMVSCAIGVAGFPADAAELDELMSSADSRMYLHKNERKVVQG